MTLGDQPAFAKTQKPDEMRKTAGGFHWAKCLHCGAWHVWSESLSLQELADRCARLMNIAKEAR